MPASPDEPRPSEGIERESGPYRENRPLVAISNAIVGLHRRYYGRGATKARTYWVHDDLILCELRDVYLTVERTLIERGQGDTVRSTRLTFQQTMAAEFTGAIESLTGRKVVAFVSESITQPEVILEIFVLEPESERLERLAREAAEDAGTVGRPVPGIA